VAAGYVGTRILGSRKHATATVVASAPLSSPPASAAAAVPEAKIEIPRSNAAAIADPKTSPATVAEAPSSQPNTPAIENPQAARSTAPGEIQTSLSNPPGVENREASRATPSGEAKASSPNPSGAEDRQNSPANVPTNANREPAGVSTGAGDSGLIAPRHGERYLQIAAIPAGAAQKFVAGLGRYNLQASVAPGPNDGLVRVVIGPFRDWEAASALKSQIQAKWPDCFVRLY
jgi:hypothetical protein